MFLIMFILCISCNQGSKENNKAKESLEKQGENISIDIPKSSNIPGNDIGSNGKDSMSAKIISRIVGDWESINNDDNQEFSISIKNSHDSLFGTYCCVIRGGAKIDCMEDDVSFSFKSSNQTIVETEFKNNFNDLKGLARLSLVNDTLKWEILNVPKGEYYCLARALLTKK